MKKFFTQAVNILKWSLKSFLFGIILSVFTNLNYGLLFNKNKKIKILGNFLFLFDFSLIYFLGI